MQPSCWEFGRRDALRIAVAGAAAAALPAQAQAARFKRWEITDPNMPPRVLDSYKKGIRAMLRLPPADPRNWYRNAFVHIFDCPHGNWWFLPWHRAYLGWFEQTIRSLSGDAEFALPYWDWTKTPRIPAAMFDDVLDPNNPAFIGTFAAFRTAFRTPVNTLWGSFSPAQRSALSPRRLTGPASFFQQTQSMFFARPNARGLTRSNPDLDPLTRTAVSGATVRAALQDPAFANAAGSTAGAGFASAKAASHSAPSDKGTLESQPHDNVHGAIGGSGGAAFMVSFLSPVDPIFYLHHGNLDRLWTVWTRRQQARNRPVLPQGADLAAWSNEKFLFFSGSTGAPVTQVNAGDYATTGLFDYEYSPGFGEDLVTPPSALVASVEPGRGFDVRLAARRPAATSGGPASGGVADVPAASLQLQPEARPATAQVTLELKPEDEGKRFRVLMSRAGSAAVEAGGITVFGNHSHGPTTFTVPLPDSIAAGDASGPPVPLDIRVVPVTPAGARQGPALAAARLPVPLLGIRVLGR